MIVRRPLLDGSAAIRITHTISNTIRHTQHPRFLHARIPPAAIPTPTPFVPDTTTFLTLIGRNLSTHASKFPSWEALFSLTSAQLKDLGVEPARTRKYLLRWRDKFRNGEFGIGGDAKYVKEGKAEVRVLEIPVAGQEGDVVIGPKPTLTRSPGVVKKIVNVDPEKPVTPEDAKEVKRLEGLHLKGSHQIYGSYVEPLKGTGGRAAVIRVQEGMWEHKRGHKIDGGERRKAEVRAKRRVAELRAQRG